MLHLQIYGAHQSNGAMYPNNTRDKTRGDRAVTALQGLLRGLCVSYDVAESTDFAQLVSNIQWDSFRNRLDELMFVTGSLRRGWCLCTRRCGMRS